VSKSRRKSSNAEKPLQRLYADPACTIPIDIDLLSPGKNKFGAKPVHSEDGYFHSTGEYKRWLELKLLRDNNHIDNLARQVVYWVESIKQQVIWDFYYTEVDRDGNKKEIVEDYKGAVTQAYRKNAKWFRHDYPRIELREVRKGKSSKRYRRW